jgi:hypothetical protein
VTLTLTRKDFVSPPSDALEGFTTTERTGNFAGNPVGAQYLNRFLREINSFNLNVPGFNNTVPGTPQIGAGEVATRVVRAV